MPPEKVPGPHGPRGVGLPERQRPFSVRTPTGPSLERCTTTFRTHPRRSPAQERPRPRAPSARRTARASERIASPGWLPAPARRGLRAPSRPAPSAVPRPAAAGVSAPCPPHPPPTGRAQPARAAQGAGAARLQPQMARGPRAGRLGGTRPAPRSGLPGPVATGDRRKGNGTPSYCTSQPRPPARPRLWFPIDEMGEGRQVVTARGTRTSARGGGRDPLAPESPSAQPSHPAPGRLQATAQLRGALSVHFTDRQTRA